MWWDVCLQDLDGVQGQSDEEMDSIRLHFPHHWMMSVYCRLFCDYYIYMYMYPSIHCSMSPHFLTRRVSRLLDWLWYPELSTVLVSIALPFAFHISVFSIHYSSPAMRFHSSIFHSSSICTPPPTLLLIYKTWDWNYGKWI